MQTRMDEKTQNHYHKKIILGEEARRLLGEDAVKDIIESSTQAIDYAVEEFIRADPTDLKTIIKIQNEIRVASAFPQWVNDKIIEGGDALTEYTQIKEMEKQEKEGQGE